MKIRLIKIGKVKKDLVNIVDNYVKRLKGFAKIEIQEFKNPEHASRLIVEESALQQNYFVALDEHGVSWSSPELAKFIKQKIDNPSIKNLTFVVGGPYGLDKKIKKEVSTFWSLSRAVFPSDLAWLLTVEQIYRAFTIINGSPYHHD